MGLAPDLWNPYIYPVLLEEASIRHAVVALASTHQQLAAISWARLGDSRLNVSDLEA